tara:strand:- start:2627 stop:2890 length:264 start_codon:yes stop_codon:yes gene_type:complete
MSNIENEQMYLDMVGQLKDKYDEITSQLESIERSGKEIKKDFITVYGVIRLLDHLISNSPVGFDDEVVIMVEVLRGFLSDCVDKYIL